MLLTLFLALFLLIVVFSRTSRKRKASESFFKYHRKFIIAGSVVLLVIVTMNVFRPYAPVFDFEKSIEKAQKNGTAYLAKNLREKRSQLHPMNVEYLFDYVEDCEKFEYYDKADLQDRRYSFSTELQRLSLAYADALAPSTTFDSVYRVEPDGSYNPDYPDTAKAFHNFVIGIQKLNDGDRKSGIDALLREKEINPSFDKTYKVLDSVYRNTNYNQWKQFVVKWENSKYLNQNQVVVDYFLMGEYIPYLRALYSNRFLDLDFSALIAGLIISIIWLIFLRNMDFFNKERWTDLLIVFLGGALLTNLCLFIYHSAHFYWGIHINGDFWNDFVYCIVVIGFSEETVKLIPWVLFAYFSKRMKEPYDYILYASVAALGFAFAENLVYLESPSNIVIRFLMSTMGHMFDASLIAYCFVLAKYKFKTKRAMILAPLIGFVLACISHGFYDFWLISSSAAGLGIITTIFFLLTIHIWFYMINNSTNHSVFFDKKLLRVNENTEFLSVSILAIILVQYVFLSIQYGAVAANTMLRFGTTFTIGFLLYITFILSNFKAIQGKWFAYSFPLSKLINEYVGFPFSGKTSSQNHTGLHLRIFCPKNNQYIGHQLPVSGHCERKITVNGDEDWYLFRMNKAIELDGHQSFLVILKPKSNGEELTEDKIELYLLFIPLGLNIEVEKISIKHLRYTGKTYSKPI